MLRNERGWSNPRVLGILAIIFCCGVVCGSAFTRQYLHHKSRMDALAIEQAQRYGVERLRVQLNLSADQVKTVNYELDEYAKYYQNIEEEREDVAEHGRQRILAVLNSGQKEKFNSIFAKAAK